MPYSRLLSYVLNALYLKRLHFGVFPIRYRYRQKILYADPHFFEVGSVHWLLAHIF